MENVRNILFIMCDQLRADYLKCGGHPTIQTPNLDRLAQKGVLFKKAYAQAALCGPSRMSFYTGRYMMSHGVVFNSIPLSIGHLTLGDYLRPQGLHVALVGKTHFGADQAGISRLEVNPNSLAGKRILQCGFDVHERDDGLHPTQILRPNLAYNQYLNQMGYPGENPWHDYANSAEGENGEILSGWFLRNSSLPARVQEEHSETPYMTNRAIEYITEKGEEPWCLHLSYIKPHWPYMAPAPYHNMYDPAALPPANTTPQEANNSHPVYQAFRNQQESVTFRKEATRQAVIPTYMGLISQIDHHLGRLFHVLETQGRMKDTMIVFTSDHGDYLGDHGLGEKQMLHEESLRLPMIVYDPRSAANSTRGSENSAFVESVDLIPTFIESVGGQVPSHRLEGRSLVPLLHNEPVDWRSFAFSECNYSFYEARVELGIRPRQAKGYMVRTDSWKYIYYEGFAPQLFDLQNDPQELEDLGQDPRHESVRQTMYEQLFEVFRNRPSVITLSEEEIIQRTGTARSRGIIIGEW